jgi:hypothetical protein
MKLVAAVALAVAIFAVVTPKGTVAFTVAVVVCVVFGTLGYYWMLLTSTSAELRKEFADAAGPIGGPLLRVFSKLPGSGAKIAGLTFPNRSAGSHRDLDGPDTTATPAGRARTGRARSEGQRDLRRRHGRRG